MTRMLEGLRVLDFGQYIAAPFAALLLADQGAEVIHVDPPGGPRWRHPADAFYNRNKQRITLDLKDAADAAIAQQLIEHADVLVENFRPGVMRRLWLGFEHVSAQNPRLIYCSIPGFASDDPRAHVAAWEGVVGAATDLYPPLAGSDPGRPVYTALPLASNFAALHAATAIVMALIARERGVGGQHIEVPLFDAMFELIGANGISVDGQYRVPRSGGTRTFVCADGRRLLCNATSTPRFQRWFSGATGADKPSPELFVTRTAHAWETLINTAGAPSTMVRTAAEWLQSDHARARRTIIELQDPELGRTWMPGVHVHSSEETEDPLEPRHLPNADRAAILARLGASEDGWRTPQRTPAQHQPGDAVEQPLSGMRVLDLTQVVAGPCTGRILAEYGADVIKLNAAHPDSLTSALSLSGRPTDPGNQQHEHLNRGKHTLLLDLHASESREIVDALVDSADVVMQNFASGMADRLGVGYERIRARKADLVYFSLSAYGYGGSMGTYRGFEGNAQAAVGLMDRFGGDGPPMAQPYLLDDYGTGIRGAFAIGLGMYHQLTTGRGQHIDISLVETATYHSAPFLLEYAGSTHDEARGTHALGSGPLQRLYRASDNWFFFGTSSMDRLSRVPDLAGIDATRLEATLEERLAQQPVSYWLPRLQAADIGAHPVMHVHMLMEDRWVREHGLSVTQTIEDVGDMTMPGVAVRMSQTPLRIGAPVRPPGDDAPAVLASIGMANRFEALMHTGALSMTHAVASTSLA